MSDEPCMCGADDCPSCFPGREARPHSALGSLDAEDIEILNAHAAADEEAEIASRRMDEETTMHATILTREEGEALRTFEGRTVVALDASNDSGTYREWDVTVDGIRHAIIDEGGTWTLMVYVPTCLEWCDVPGMDVDTFLSTHRLILAA